MLRSFQNSEARPIQKNEHLCNCQRGINNCPLGGMCRTESIVYKATVISSDGDVRTYTCLTNCKLKDRLYEYNANTNKPNHHTFTRLADYVWKKKEQRVDINNYKWEYQPGQKKCDLCLTEKMMIMKDRNPCSLNKRSDLMNWCQHKWPYRLDRAKYKPDERHQ